MTVERLSLLKDIKPITRCFVVLVAHTDQFKNSYFVKTIVEWNQLSEPQGTGWNSRRIQRYISYVAAYELSVRFGIDGGIV